MPSASRRSQWFAVGGLGLAALALGVATQPVAAAEPIVEYREAIMEAIGGHTGALKQIITGGVTFADQAKPHVLALGSLAKMVDGIFPPGSGADSHALPAIWEKPADFAKAVSAFKSAVAELEKQADASPREMAPAFEGLVKSCKGCHDSFRKKD
ncbi:MAG: cytochrome c [Rhodospirillales bacterium]